MPISEASRGRSPGRTQIRKWRDIMSRNYCVDVLVWLINQEVLDCPKSPAVNGNGAGYYLSGKAAISSRGTQRQVLPFAIFPSTRGTPSDVGFHRTRDVRRKPHELLFRVELRHPARDVQQPNIFGSVPKVCHKQKSTQAITLQVLE
jgi:hypothetical protein